MSSDLGDFVPATLELALYGMGLALILAGLLAFGTTLKWPGAGVLRAVLFTGASAPMFLLGILGLIVFYQKLGWVPANGRISVPNPPTGPTGLLTVDGLLAGRFDVVTDALHHLILPAVVIALGPAVAIGRVLRSSLLTDADSDYARTARAKGLSEGRIMVGHVLRNSRRRGVVDDGASGGPDVLRRAWSSSRSSAGPASASTSRRAFRWPTFPRSRASR